MKKITILALLFSATCMLSCYEDTGSDTPPAPVEGATALTETFEGLAVDAMATTLSGWSELLVKGNVSWKGVKANGNTCIEISAVSEAADCETWLLTPALDLASAPDKTLRFSTQYAFWREGSSLDVYLLLATPSTGNAVKLAIGEAPDYVRIAKQSDEPNVWIPSGDINLSRYAELGVVYVAFCYTAKGGADNSTTFRIDNVTLGSVSVPDGGVTSLSENFESFAEGYGDAYMSAQPDSKGWKGISLTGELEADIRISDDKTNKFMQFSAHRKKITTATVQEFWLISPALDVTGAASKCFSFDVAGGYYKSENATIFELYAMDSDNPATASKTKLTWSEPGNIPADAYGAFASSGNIDLSVHSGVRYIGFYYKGTSGSENSTTYQMDNFLFGSEVSATPVLRFTSAAAASAIAGKAFTHTFTLEEKNLTDTTAIACSNLPSWLTLTGKTIAGTAPDMAGTHALNITATSGSQTATQALTITVIVAPPPGSNMLLNGSFEDFAQDVPAEWSIGTGVNNNPVVKIETGAQEGSLAVKLAGNKDGRCDVKQTIGGVVPGATYTVSFWYKDNTKGVDNQGIRIWANFLKGNDPIKPEESSPLQPDKTLDPASDWTLFAADVVAPADADAFNFEIRATKNNSGVVDNCSFAVKQ
ncbi:MAG: choice-of-anchor J domain-containing protein [Prevotellaceae bacterium]|nr:choice-of-anchor J domain-containing protein [Prevotellaceae bacterium]